MFNVITLVISFFFLMAVWKIHAPDAAEESLPASFNPTQKRDESR
jgi:hypothetical protein